MNNSESGDKSDMWSLAATVVGCALILSGSGCAPGDTDLDDGDDVAARLPGEGVEEEIGEAQQAIDPSFTSSVFWWDQTQGAEKQLMPTSSSMCVLTRVGGHFQGSGEKVRLYAHDGYWWLGGTSSQLGVHAEAYCFYRSAFLVPSGGTTMISGEFSVTDYGGCSSTSGVTWYGDAATMLSGMRGHFAGGGEFVEVNQSPSGFTPSTLLASSCQPDMVRAVAHAFFAGLPGTSSTANFWGAEKQVATDNSSPQEVRMAPVGEAMCYLTRVSGQFDGGGEFVAVYPKVDSDGLQYWFLKASAGSDCSFFGCAKKPVFGNARCYSRDQR